MHLFLTDVLPFLAHDHASAVAFLTCRHHNFHASIIPEFLSDEDRVESFCRAPQWHRRELDKGQQFAKLYNLFVQTPLMQFSPSFVIFHHGYVNVILKSLLKTKYFTRTLQRCSLESKVGVKLAPDLNIAVVQSLSKVQSLTKLDLGDSLVENQHMEIIINSFTSLETLTVLFAGRLEVVDPSVAAIKVTSPPPLATKTLRNLTLTYVDPLVATQLIAHFPNLRKVALSGQGIIVEDSGHRPWDTPQPLDLRPLSSSLPLLTDLTVERYTLQNVESLKSLVHLTSFHFDSCRSLDLSVLTQDRSSELTTIRIYHCRGLSPSLAHL